MASNNRNRRSLGVERGALRIGTLVAVLIGGVGVARADLVISSGATSNVICASGTCTATASNAGLNVGTLKTMLASGNVTVTTANATDTLTVRAPLTWSTSNTLSLTATQSIAIDALVVVKGFGGIALSTNNGSGLGNLAFASAGRVNFKHPHSKLTINGLRYSLVTSVAELATAASANPNARLALADNYDAKPDGTYSAAPTPTFNGLFEGLGNTISNLTIATASSAAGNNIGLFGTVGKGCARCGRINGINLTGFSLKGYYQQFTGGLVGVLDAEVSQSSVTGLVSGGPATVGGLVGMTSKNAIVTQSHAFTVGGNIGALVNGGLIGDNQGTVRETYSLSNVAVDRDSTAGGLVGTNEGTITTSFASGKSGARGHTSNVGGLVGKSSGAIIDCYATGTAKNVLLNTHGTSPGSFVGGLVGTANAPVISSYSTAAVAGDTRDKIGGLIGFDGIGGMKHNYWNRSTSGVTSPSAGAGNIANDPGITGQTTAQLTAKLPAGFSPTVWARNPNINGGLPYLIANPPPK